MFHNITLNTTIAASLVLAFIIGFIVVRLKLPALLGYLIAGISDEEAQLLQSENASRVFFGEHELAQSIIQHVLTTRLSK